MTNLATDFSLCFGMYKGRDARPCRFVVCTVKSGASGRDPALGRDACHLGKDQTRSALGPFAIVDQMPVIWRAIHRLILRHWRDNDPIFKLKFT